MILLKDIVCFVFVHIREAKSLEKSVQDETLSDKGQSDQILNIVTTTVTRYSR